MSIPKEGILVKLMPFTPDSQIIPDSTFKPITNFEYGLITLNDGSTMDAHNKLKLYDSPNGGEFKLLDEYTSKYSGRLVPDSVVSIIKTKYIDTKNPTQKGGRFSRKKYKKSFKRGRSMKRYVSKSRKYRIRK
jgi:hypothetical protein